MAKENGEARAIAERGREQAEQAMRDAEEAKAASDIAFVAAKTKAKEDGETIAAAKRSREQAEQATRDAGGGFARGRLWQRGTRSRDAAAAPRR